MWTPETVRLRFTEAAATEAFLSTSLPPQCRGYWPSFIHDAEDLKGWDDAARLDNAERFKGRAPEGAVARHWECQQWSAERIHDEKTRKIVWAFSFCRAYKREFGKLCQKKGWVKTTAYNRLNRTWDRLSSQFNNEGLLLKEPAPEWSGHEAPVLAPICATMGEAAPAPAAIKFTPGYRTEPSRDTLDSSEKIEDFAKFLERRNARLRKIQEWRNEGVA